MSRAYDEAPDPIDLTDWLNAILGGDLTVALILAPRIFDDTRSRVLVEEALARRLRGV